MSYMAGNRPFGTRKGLGNNKTPIYTIQGTFWKNRKKSSFWTKKWTSKILKVDFGHPLISDQYDDMGGRYTPSGPPSPHNIEVFPLPLTHYIRCPNFAFRSRKPIFFGFCCFCCVCCFSGYHDVVFLKVWIMGFLWKKKLLKNL